MKKIYTLSVFIFCLSFAKAQNSIPNGNFENWTTGTYEYPSFATQTSNPEAFLRCQVPFNCLKTSDYYHGAYAVQLVTHIGADTCFGYFINGNPNGPPTNYWPGGIPYNQQATGVRGYYKNNTLGNDTARILLSFKLNGANIGVYVLPFYGVHNSYTPFNITFSPALPFAPDTVIIAAASSDFLNNNLVMNNSMFQLDSLTFTGVASQPAQFDGDFETWNSQTIYSPTNWYSNTNDAGTSVTQTTDRVAGNFACELMTYLGQRGPNSTPAANSSSVSTGMWSNSCNCQLGGNAFTNQIDTLEFYYKYLPSGNDSAEVDMNYILNGNSINWFGRRLGASASYQLVDIPFNLAQAPDSVIININSSLWQDSALTYVGSDLKVDEMHFKTQPLTTSIPVAFSGLKNIPFVYPNPSNGIFIIQSPSTIDRVEVMNDLGEMIYSSESNSQSVNVNLSSQAAGIYFVKILSGEKIFTEKIIVK
ncbi:MAG: T9SS type A sorting domain-containing protein [Bacteroidetes bacterium]|nr:T9SS type A sorting domain-containing protein [Bacteroidota bacterium]